MFTPENIDMNNLILFLLFVLILGMIINFLFIAALIRALSKRTLSVDDPTGEKKQKIFDALTKVIEDVKSTV